MIAHAEQLRKYNACGMLRLSHQAHRMFIVRADKELRMRRASKKGCGLS